MIGEEKIPFAKIEYDSIIPFKNLPLDPVFPYNINHLTLSWRGIDWSAPHKLQYSYLLGGKDKSWSPLVKDNQITYLDIRPGAYTFKVRAVGRNGLWSETRDYSFRIRPPWWLTWWAKTIYGFLFMVAIWLTHRYQKGRVVRIERAKAQEKELEQAREIEKAYTGLKATQAQLIQSEKMASLGALTAGIAHEIQNPLNFVNNFSEVSTELLDEANEELNEGNASEVSDILSDVRQNLEKIHHHGGRASSIVKGMLAHSRASSGDRAPTDINNLCDEYIRLSYHGLRAKDKSFNAAFETHFDESIAKVDIVPQEIGRVLLNIVNNAFYAVSSKAKSNSETLAEELPSERSKYEPKVVLTTRLKSSIEGGADGVEININDNGPGIPKEVVDKVFQPFFTTKPTGQGTGLGLSLAYDIVKAHGGEIKVESEESKGSTFTIVLPIE